jgi:hypothetical protein
MKKWFITPDGSRVEIAQAMEKGLLSPFYPRPFLEMCAQEREWTGEPSTTQLINGTRLEYLKLTTDYALDPSDMAFAALGTRTHKMLEDIQTRLTFNEEKMHQDDISGIVDLLELQPDGSWWLEDYKTWGSFKVGKALGLVKRERPVLDEAGAPVLLKSGPNKGKPKTAAYYVQDPAKVDMEDVIWQLNRYRLMSEAALREPVRALKTFIFVRDGGTYMAKNRGIDRTTYYLDVPFREDRVVRQYFEAKKEALLGALGRRRMPPRCSDYECWDGRRCLGYCPVADACRAEGDNPYLQAGAEELDEDAASA